MFSASFRVWFFLIICVLLISACAGGPAVIGDEITPAELIQRAQEASDRNRYNLALQYYQALLDRHPNEIGLVCIGEYEIAFIHYKQKKYPQAREELNALLERYNGPDAELLPRQFKRLAAIVLDRLNEKEKNIDPISTFLMWLKKKEESA